MAPPCYSSPAPLPLPNLAKSSSRLLPSRGTNRYLASPCTRYTSPPSPHTNTHTATQPHSPYRLSRHHQTPPHTPTLRHTHTQPNRVANAQPERHEALHLLGTLIRTVPGPGRQPRKRSASARSKASASSRQRGSPTNESTRGEKAVEILDIVPRDSPVPSLLQTTPHEHHPTNTCEHPETARTAPKCPTAQDSRLRPSRQPPRECGEC